MKKIRRIISITLMVMLIAGLVPSNIMIANAGTSRNLDGPADNVFVQMNGENIDNLSIAKDERVLISSYSTIEGEKQYRWEILIDQNTNKWVEFYNCNESNLNFSYAMVSNFLDSRDLAQIRAVVLSGEDTYVSDSVLVEILDDRPAYSKKSNPQLETEPFVLTSEPSIAAFSTRSSGDVTESNDDNTVTITINYLKNTGEQVCDPYVATMFKGMSFKSTVLSPQVAGFEPKLNETDTELAESYSFDIPSVEEDIEVDIIYYPVQVKYEVRYYFQGTYDDEYTMDGVPVIAYGEVGTEPDENLIGAEFEGFVQVNYQPEVIAADGSTVFQCFYDREYYLVDLDLDGGYGADSVYAKYGTAFVVNDPKKPGYIFDGWDFDGDGKADEMPSMIPAQNLECKALWKTTETKYTVVYWYENANDNEYSVAGTKEVTGVLSGTVTTSSQHQNDTFTGRDTKHFTYNSRKNETCLIEGDGSSVINVYYTRNKYTITFKATGVCALEEHTHDESCGQLVCDIPIHEEHTEECIICGVTEHSHSSECCTITEHEHTAICYISSTRRCNKKHNGAANTEGTTFDHGNGATCVRYNNTWYPYTEGKVNTNYCDSHVHDQGDCTCPVTVHVHTDSCYNDELHIHDNDCYDIFCEKDEHKHSTACTNSSTTNVIKTVTRKYNADIGDLWPVVDAAGNVYDSGERWKPSESSYYTEVLVYLAVMPDDDFVLTLNKSSNDTYIMHYNLEALPGVAGTSYNGKVYNEAFSVSANYNFITEAEDFFDIQGFSKVSSKPSFSGGQIDINGGGDVYFYYSRNSYNLSFYNYNGVVDGKGGQVLYGAALKDYYFKPDYPSTLEDNAYDFAGWYTTEGCYEGSEFDFSNGEMPSDNLVLYAKWVPKTHEVTFYNTYQDMEEGAEPLKVVEVNHGAVLETSDIPETSNSGYTAGEWFYIKNGEKVAYRPVSIPVKNDIVVYKDWTSNTVVNYTVYYYKKGTSDPVAEPITGWMFEGSTKTFKAKGGGELAQLYPDYNEGWYPTVSSTSIVGKDGDNTVIFYYDYQNPNPYTVKYVDADTGNELVESKVVSDNSKSVVTEVYKPIDGYIPDAYYKQLILSLNKVGDADYDPDKNVLTFFYRKASNSAYYAIEYYFMNPDGTTYKMNARIQSPITIGTAANIPDLSTEGFSFEKCQVKDGDDDTFTDVSAENMGGITVDKNGALIQVYYKREKTSYKVHYYLVGTQTPIKEDKEVEGIYFGTEITEESEEFLNGYRIVGEQSHTKELLLDPQYNEFTFYYDEAFKTARYKAVVRKDYYEDLNFGFVSHTQDVKKMSQSYDQVTATERTGFYFDGWYSDEECTVLVSKEKNITPDTEENITYYALFEPYVSDLKISKSGEKLSEDQTFIFNVVGNEPINDHVNIDVTIHGKGEITVTGLPLGEYTVTEKTDWAWNYAVVGSDNKTIDVVLDPQNNQVDFVNSNRQLNWLSSDDSKLNIFK